MLTAALLVCLWGKPVTVLERMPSGRAGYDALLVQRRDNSAPFFVLLERSRQLNACN